MARKSNVAKVAILATIAVVLFSPFASVIGSNVGTQSVGNETVTADVGNYTELDGYDIDGASVTVTNVDDTVTYSEGSDYEINTTDGSIKALSGGNISDGQTIEVSYDYQATSGTTTTIANLLPLFVALLILVIIASRVMTMMP